MQDKIVLITGSTAGIGKATAVGLAKQGYKIVIVGRDAAKAQQAADDIKAQSGSKEVDYLTADLSSQKSVKQLAAEFKAKYPRLDVLINNAGAVYNKYELSVDGIEMQMAINHMAYFILTMELLDYIKQTSPSGRIVNVASHSHYGGKLNFDDLFMAKNYGGYTMYERTKLCNVLFTLELAERLKGSNVTVNALHPGVVKTDIGKKHGGWLYALGWGFFANFGMSVDKGAATSIYLASSPEVEGVSGKYWAKSNHKWHSRYSQTEGLKEKLWEATEKLVK